MTPSHQKPVTQFASPAASFVPHPVRHAVALAQTRLPGHGAGLPVPHVPDPSQTGLVSVLPEHDTAPHDVDDDGKTQAPLALQSVAPQVVPVGLQAAEQQWVPVPETPQTPLVH